MAKNTLEIVTIRRSRVCDTCGKIIYAGETAEKVTKEKTGTISYRKITYQHLHCPTEYGG